MRAMLCLAAAVLAIVVARPACAEIAQDIRRAQQETLESAPPAALAVADRLLARSGLTDDERMLLHAMRARAILRSGHDDPGDIRLAVAEEATSDDRYAVRTAIANAWMAAGNLSDKRQNWARSVFNYSQVIAYDCRCDTAYRKRADAYIADDDVDAGIADYRRAIAIAPGAAVNYRWLGLAYEMKLDFEDAIAAYDKAVARDPDDNNGYSLRGRALAVIGRYQTAQADLEKALALAPGCMPVLVWLHIVHLRTHVDDRDWLRTAWKPKADAGWPGPALNYFVDAIDSPSLVHIALTSDGTKKMHQRCDGWFYLGEEAMAHGDTGAARALFRRTATNCNAVDYEWAPARVELKRMAG